MMNQQYDTANNTIESLKYTNQKPKTNKETNKENKTVELKLPEQKGTRTTILRMIFEKMESKEINKMGLINKEFYQISRDQLIWKLRIEFEFPFLISRNPHHFSFRSFYGRFLFDDRFDSSTVSSSHLLSLLDYQFSKSSSFCEYWNIRNRLLQIVHEFNEPLTMGKKKKKLKLNLIKIKKKKLKN